MKAAERAAERHKESSEVVAAAQLLMEAAVLAKEQLDLAHT